MKAITIPTYRRIRRRIISFKKIDLMKTEQSDLIELIKNSFTIPTGLFTQKPSGNPIYWACINTDSDNNHIFEPFVSKNRISYNKNPDNYGRCNLIDKPVFYGADGLEIAASEACNNILSKKMTTFFLTVGEWRLQNDISVSIVCHSRKALKRSGDLILAYQGLLRLEKKRTGANQILGFGRLKIDFFRMNLQRSSSRVKRKNIYLVHLYAFLKIEQINNRQKEYKFVY